MRRKSTSRRRPFGNWRKRYPSKRAALAALRLKLRERRA